MLRKSCDGGTARGCAGLGLLYESRLGVTTDITQAIGFFTKGCDGGFSFACRRLGTYFEKVGANRREALTRYEQGCRLGDADACKDAARLARP